MAGLLRHLGVLPPDPRTGRMAAPTRAHVLLETVAPVPHQGEQSSGAGGGQTHGDPDGDQQQELLAPVAVAGDAGRDDERLVEDTGAGEYP